MTMTTPTVSQPMMDHRRSTRQRRWMIAALAIVGVVTAGLLYDRLFRERAAPYFESNEEHFLYGSIGSESIDGVPYWIWLVLPRIFPDLLPGAGGYSALGMVSQDGHELPVGISMVTIGYPRVAFNCAFCHTASVRTRVDEPPRIVAGAPAHQTVAQQYSRFLMAAAADPRFTAGTILGEISRNYRLSALDRLLYRFVVIPGTRQRLLRLRDQTAWMNSRPAWGAGRADVFSPIKFQRLTRPPDEAIGTADMMPLWNLGARPQGLFWDGSTASLRDAVLMSALSAGASRPWLDADITKWDQSGGNDRSSLRRIHDYMASLKPPPYPFSIDKQLASAGEPIYRAECAGCHAAGGGGANPGASGGTTDTDEHRRNVWTAGAATAYDTFAGRRAWKSPPFRTRDSYLAVSLDGLWLRAPYLHNGSVPSLTDLLEPQHRPSRFWRGYDVYDAIKVGFISDGPEAQRAGTLFDTSQTGNANTGHTFGAALPAESKRALLEYLKTL
jgi:mono/diheme cytochrome c family protein